MVIVIVAVVAHWPVSGVKVYVVVAVLFSAGNHVPVMPLFEVVGNADNVAPEQIAATWVNVGVTFGFMVTSTLTLELSQPAIVCVTQ